MGHQYRANDSVVVIGRGIGRVVARDDDGLTLLLDDSEFVLAPGDVEELLRPVVSREEAQSYVEFLCSDPRDQEPRGTVRVSPLRNPRSGCRRFFPFLWAGLIRGTGTSGI